MKFSERRVRYGVDDLRSFFGSGLGFPRRFGQGAERPA